MPKIVVLPKNIAELIAAGEVVERPASVVKELCENALDSGADQIVVELQNGGSTLIRVTDNGCGIHREDIRNAFKRNATSKVRSVEELYAIATLGFRGEALPSIAAMARVELLTRTADELAGTRYVIEGGEEKELSDAGCPVGTTILVRDLFFNTPARQKFMKSNRTEGAAASQLVEKLALSRPETAFRLIRDGTVDFASMGDGDPLHCIRQVLGREFADSLMPVETEDPPLAISGYVSRADAARGSRSGQNVFINGRYVRSRTVSAALEESYAGHIMTGRFPACVLYLAMPYAAIDVNVHPSKMEVRFAQEKPIFDLVYGAVRGALEQNRAMPQMRVNPTPAQKYAAALRLQQSLPAQEAAELIASQMGKNQQTTFDHPGAASADRMPPQSRSGEPAFLRISAGQETDPAKETPAGQGTATAKEIAAGQGEKPVASPGSVSEPPAERSTSPAGFPDLLSGEPEAPHPQPEMPPVSESIQVSEPMPDPAPAPKPVHTRLIGEAFGTYLLVERGDSLLLVDKHAAHERLLYEQLKTRNAHLNRQVLLVPVVLHPGRAEYELMTAQCAEYERLGFLIEDFGGQTVLVREVPSVLLDGDIESMVMEITEKLRTGSKVLTPERLDDLLHSIACRAAIKAHDESLRPELDRLLEQLAERPDLQSCPHGRPIYMELTRHVLEREFGRLG